MNAVKLFILALVAAIVYSLLLNRGGGTQRDYQLCYYYAVVEEMRSLHRHTVTHTHALWISAQYVWRSHVAWLR